MSHLDQDAIDTLEKNLGYSFKDRGLLRQALIHRSFTGEQGLDESYERLEFLGDAVLQLSVTQYLYTTKPHLSEGEMAKVRAAVVNERTLAKLARDIEVGPALLLGRGEDLTGGRDKDSLLSDVVEALVGAIYLEIGFDAGAAFVISHWGEIIDERSEAPGRRDYKTRLQETLARRGVKPRYELTETGPEHAKRFTARVHVAGDLLGEGVGTSKKRAEQEAAKSAADRLDGDA